MTCQDTLKYFYDNYKDYFYLPKEDTAIHKSVATYVDKDFRQKAKTAFVGFEPTVFFKKNLLYVSFFVITE